MIKKIFEKKALFKKILLISIIFLTILSLIGTASAEITGTGSSTNPFQITTIGDLQKFKEHYDGRSGNNTYYLLTANIDGKGAIVQGLPKFSSNFNGNGKKISNIIIDPASNDNSSGMFGTVEPGSMIENIKFDTVSITHNNSGQVNQIHAVGILAGALNGDDVGISIIIKDIHINNSNVNMGEVNNNGVTYETYTGGLVGKSENTVMENITVENTKVVSAATKGQVGGVIGYINEPEIGEYRFKKVENISIINVTVTNDPESDPHTDKSAGGIIGKANNVIINDVTVNGATITGNENVGGIIGNAINSSLHSTDTNQYKNQIYGNVKIIGVERGTYNNDPYGGRQVGGVFGESNDSDALNVNIIGTAANPIEITGFVNVGGVYGRTINSGTNNSSLANMSISWINVTGMDRVAAGTGRAGTVNSPSPTLITNLEITNAVVNAENGEDIGIIFGYLKADSTLDLMRDANIKDCKINAPDASRVGGIAGKSDNGGKFSVDHTLGIIKIENLEIDAAGTGSSVGGYIGAASGDGLEITFAELNNIKINASNQTGGLIGELSNFNTAYIGHNKSSDFTNSNVTINNLEITTDRNDRKNEIGGLIGKVTGGILYIGKENAGPSSENPTGITMATNVVTYGGNNVGGMIGSNEVDLYAENFYLNNAKFNSLDSSGALIGKASGNSDISIIKANVNAANIEGTTRTSGGIGSITERVNVIIDDFQYNNLNVTGSGDSTGGIIGYIETGTNNEIKISNVVMDGTKPDLKITGKGQTGGIIGYLNGTSSDFKVTVLEITINNMTINSETSTGGIVGAVYDIHRIDLSGIKTNNMTINAINNVGGIIGLRGTGGDSENNPTVKNIIINDLAITGKNSVGGIAGEVREVDIENISIHNINITAMDYVGGLFGTTAGKQAAPLDIGNSTKKDDIKLTGNVKISGEICVGGLVGNGMYINITNISLTYSAASEDEFNVNGTEYVGGLVGTSVRDIIVTDVTVTNAKIKGSNNASAVVGKSLNGTFKNVTVNNSYIENGSIPKENLGGLIGYSSSDNVKEIFINDLFLNSSSNNTGGVIGNMYGTNLTDIRINSSTIKGNNQTGGIAGFATYDQDTSTIAIENSTVNNTSVTGNIFCGGLIGQSLNQEINNSHVIDSTVTGTQYTGGFAGRQSNGNITSSSVLDSTGNNLVKGETHVGGFIGQIEGNVSNCSAQINVSNATAVGNYTGGFAGTLNREVKNCFSTGNVTAQGGEVGGFSGRQSGTTVNCYSTGNVNGGTFGGSFTGNLNSGNITNCYSTGNVTSATAGGLVGTTAGSKITNAMAFGAYVNGTTADKLIGSGTSTVSNTFVWNGMKNANGQISNTQNVPAVKSYNVWDTYETPKTPSDLKKSKWDSTWTTEIWKNNNLGSAADNSYLLPVFTWQTAAPNADASHILYMTDIEIKVAEAI